jgi:ribosome-binding factor A
MSERMRRVNESVRQVLAETLPELKDPRIGLVTVTAVETAPDLRHAVVYVSVLGGEKRRARSLAALERAHGVLQQRVARELRLRRTPQLIFQYDETVDRALRMSELIDQVVPASSQEQRGDDDPST